MPGSGRIRSAGLAAEVVSGNLRCPLPGSRWCLMSDLARSPPPRPGHRRVDELDERFAARGRRTR